MARRPTCPPREVLRQPKRSSADLPDWARDWQRDAVRRRLARARAGRPSSAAATRRRSQQMIYFEEMSRREIPRSLNPQGLGIIAPSIHDYGTDEQRERFLAPDAAGRDRVVPRHERAGAPGSDLASLRDARGARRRPLRRQRSEGVDLGRAPRRLVPLLRAHRSRRAEAQGHQRAASST